jgi:diguanylate cyclase (GGDEF)-like protein
VNGPAASSILLVEDSDTYAEIVERLLAGPAPDGWNLSVAPRLADAREWLLSNTADCVLLDLGLPDAKGLDTVAGVRSAAPHVPIVVLSGLDDERIATASLQHGVQDYLNKADIDGRSLRRAIRYAAERKRTELVIQHQAAHDALTGLPNRGLFMDSLQTAISRLARTRSAVAVLFVDLDRFKLVNDTLGHDAGDELLVEVAKRISSALRAGDVAARLGGDEFVVLVDNVENRLDAVTVADRLHGVLRGAFTIAGREVRVTASIGISQTGNPGADPVTLLSEADVALYQAKSLGKARSELFDAELSELARARDELERDLRGALAQGQLLVHYQPVVELDGGRIASAEALVRWLRPSGKLIPPVDFLAVAEDTGLIAKVDDLVLRAACHQLAAWREAGHPIPFVSVNVSTRQLCDPTFPGRLAAMLRETGADPRAVCLEVTEGAVLADEGAAWEALRRLKGVGVRLALDDFGIGYSCLTHVRRRAFDLLKIERSFAADAGVDAGATAMLAAVIGLAKALNVEVVIKGIETPGQAARLQEIGCGHGQGFLFGSPGPASALIPSA